MLKNSSGSLPRYGSHMQDNVILFLTWILYCHHNRGRVALLTWKSHGPLYSFVLKYDIHDVDENKQGTKLNVEKYIITDENMWLVNRRVGDWCLRRNEYVTISARSLTNSSDVIPKPRKESHGRWELQLSRLPPILRNLSKHSYGIKSPSCSARSPVYNLFGNHPFEGAQFCTSIH